MCIALARVALALMYAFDKANKVFVLDHGVQRDRRIDHFEIIIKVYSSKVDVFKQPFFFSCLIIKKVQFTTLRIF